MNRRSDPVNKENMHHEEQIPNGTDTEELSVGEKPRDLATETALKKANRALRAISLCTQALVRANDEARLLDQVCQVLVELGDYSLVWVGYIDPNHDKLVRPVAWSGNSETSISLQDIRWDESEQGQGPTGVAIRTGRPVITGNIFTSPQCSGWHEEARQRQFASSIALPLIGENQVIGVLNLYAREPEAFDAEETSLLTELAEDLAFGITALRSRAEHRRAVEALSESEARYRRLLEDAGDAIIITDVETGIILEANQKAATLVGHPLTELVGKPHDMLHPPENPSGLISHLRSHNEESPVVVESVLRRSDGSDVPVEISANLLNIGGRHIIHGIFHDISERKRAEEAIRSSQERLEMALRGADLGLWDIDLVTDEAYFNERWAEILGYQSSELWPPHNKSWRMLLNPEDEARVNEALTACLEGRSTFYEAEFRMQSQDGSWRWILSRGKVLARDAQGRPMRLSGTHQDITDRKQAEEALARRAAEFEAVNRVSTALRRAETIEEMLPILLEETLAVLDAGAGLIALFDPATGELEPSANRGWFARSTQVLPQSPEGSGDVYIAPNLDTDAHTLAEFLQGIPPGYGGACIPIRSAQAAVGMLFVSAPLPREFNQVEIRLLNTLADIAGNAIHRMRLHEQTERRLRNIFALRAIDQAISSNLDLRESLAVLLEQAVNQLRVDAACVMVYSPFTQRLRFSTGMGFLTPAISRLDLSLGEGNAGQVALERRTLHVDNLSATGKIDLLKGEGFIEYYGVPLVAKGQIKGVLEIYHRSALHPEQEWLEFLETLARQAAIAIDNAELLNNLQRKNIEMALAYDSTLEGWSRALDLRDHETEGHTRRVVLLTERLARAIDMGESELVHIRRGALLHDIGKMGVPDSILLKPGPLTPEEWQIMRQHPQYAYEMLSPIAFLRPALDIPYCHHEKWDGSGYPRRLKGEQIPLSARVFAVADVWDALCSDRPYRPAWKEEKAVEYIIQESAKHFDPVVVDTFIREFQNGHLLEDW